MVSTKELVSYLDELLQISRIPGDSSNNGLQVEGSESIRHIVFGVDACAELFQEAARKRADMIFTHHGLSWGSNLKRLTGMTAARMQLLFNNGINLYAAHLPLDGHPEIGHNRLLADMLHLENCRPFAEYDGAEIGFCGELAVPPTAHDIGMILEQNLNTKATIYGDAQKPVAKIGIVSGGGGHDGLLQSIGEGLDCFVTGEISHCCYHTIKESGHVVVAAGHYATETPGVKAVMEKVAESFDVACEFVDLPTGM